MTARWPLFRRAAAGVSQDFVFVCPSLPKTIVVQSAVNRYPDESLATQLLSLCENVEYEFCGDFRIAALGVKLRAFFQEPSQFVVVFVAGDVEWVDVRLEYRSRKYKHIYYSWSSAPEHDGQTPPWAELVHRPGAAPDELLAAAREFATSVPSGLTARKRSPMDLATVLQEAWTSEVQWRNGKGSASSQPRGRLKKKAIAEPDADQLSAEIDRIADVLLQRALGDRYDHADIACEDRLDKIEKLLRGCELSGHARETLRAARDRTEPCQWFNLDQTPRRLQIDRIVGDDAIRFPVEGGEVWTDRAIADVKEAAEQTRAAWCRLGGHCLTATASRPSTRWKQRALELIEPLGRHELQSRLQAWLPLITEGKPAVESRWVTAHPLHLRENGQIVLRGLIWCYSLFPDEAMTPLLGTVGISAYRKIPKVGARAVKVGNACVYALGSQGGADCVAQLAMMQRKVKTGSARNLIEKQLEEAASDAGVSRAELEEMSVPAFGMQEVGVLTESFGDFTAVLQLSGRKSQLSWRKPDGKSQKSVPAAVKKDFAAELKELKATAKEMEKMQTAERSRLESLYLQPASWTVPVWKQRYLNHPLTGCVARRLLWTFTDGDRESTALYRDGGYETLEGSLEVTDDMQVRLWHPLGESAENVLAWRLLLEAHEICQPFRQAHREIYLLTDAERTTGTYSNRQAAHILSQTRYRTLAQERRWTVNFLGAWDGSDEGTAEIGLPAFDLRAAFQVTAAWEDEEYEVRYVSTDQVRFYRPADSETLLPLADVPAMVFSEIMRDVDLFVGVASVGNDPNWADGGPEGVYREYWQDYAFGELSATANTRRQVLERLLPRLKIADRCELDGRFLQVRGQLRTYRIHLGSGNILMQPNDEYLCIVPSRSTAAVDRLSLPFEGDSTLGVILSKAFLLADDHRITDTTITSQIGT
ncbi:MAG: DUF4132 domain-containing protein [Planctomycetaceae bacterium]|nr:DUF4132 domain-containing protein [Planctomycetaceae bacterium]